MTRALSHSSTAWRAIFAAASKRRDNIWVADPTVTHAAARWPRRRQSSGSRRQWKQFARLEEDLRSSREAVDGVNPLVDDVSTVVWPVPAVIASHEKLVLEGLF